MIDPLLSQPAADPAAPLAPVVRAERPEDAEWIEALQAECFGPERFARASYKIRETIPLDTSLSMVAEIGGEPVASVWMTPIQIGGVQGYLLGPLTTNPAFRKRGAGRLLVREVSALALARPNVRFVMLVGDEPYYGPLGFAHVRSNGIEFPAPVDPNRVLIMTQDPSLVFSLSGAIEPVPGA